MGLWFRLQPTWRLKLQTYKRPSSLNELRRSYSNVRFPAEDFTSVLPTAIETSTSRYYETNVVELLTNFLENRNLEHIALGVLIVV